MNHIGINQPYRLETIGTGRQVYGRVNPVTNVNRQVYYQGPVGTGRQTAQLPSATGPREGGGAEQYGGEEHNTDDSYNANPSTGFMNSLDILHSSPVHFWSILQ